MTFLSPSILFGLLAISIPLIIHLFSQFRTQKIEFSTIHFIKNMEHETIRNIKIKQWIVLLLRMIIIGALVLMFSRPVMEGFIPDWVGAELESRVVIVVDNSASMSANVDGKMRLDRSKKSIVNMIHIYGENTHFELYQTNPPRRLFSGQQDLPIMTSVVQSIQPTASTDDLWNFVDSIIVNIESTEPNKECIIFSDFQTWPEPKQTINQQGQSWRYYFVHQGEIQDNLSIVDLSSLSRIKLKNQLLKLNTRILNNGTIPKPNIPIELMFDHHRVGQVVTEFSPNTSKDFQFQAFPTGEMLVESKIKLPKDDFLLDNELIIHIPISHQIRCVIFSRSTDDNYLLETALQAINTKSEFLTIETNIQPNINRLFLEDVDVAIFQNPGTFSQQSIQELKTFLEKGGGAIWFEGANQMDHLELVELGLPQVQKVLESKTGFYKTKKGNAFESIFQDLHIRHLEREMPEVYQYAKIKPNVDDKVHLMLHNGDPLLVERSVGYGTLFYFSTLIDLHWNDLPMKGSFLPFLHSVIATAGTDKSNSGSIQVDEHKWVELNHQLLNQEWECEYPSGNKEKLIPDFKLKGVNIQNTHELGSYTLYTNGNPYTSFATQLHPNELAIEPIQRAQLLDFFPSDQVKWLANSDDFETAFNEARHGKSLWKTFLLAALIAMMAESILSRGSEDTLKAEDKLDSGN